MSKIIVDQIENLSGQNFVLPTSDGSAGDVMRTDGAGNLSFQSPPKSNPSGKIQSNDWGIVLPSKETMLNDPTGCVVVGETTNYCSASGNSCTWTVPAGVTEAQFQVWGAGGNGSGCNASACCYMGLMGSNGEYTYVRMAVNPGEVYTLCAGGGAATTTGSCYSYDAANGCSSYVCGSNSTCIMSCGGDTGYAIWSSSNQVNGLYPKSFPNTRCCTLISYMCTTTMCHNFIEPSARWGGECGFGAFTSGNEIKSSGKVPAMSGSYTKCGECNTGYVKQQSGPAVMDDHTLCRVTCGFKAYLEGCCWNTASVWNKPGIGGPALNHMCNYSSSPCYSGRSRSGKVLVKYK